MQKNKKRKKRKSRMWESRKSWKYKTKRRSENRGGIFPLLGNWACLIETSRKPAIASLPVIPIFHHLRGTCTHLTLPTFTVLLTFLFTLSPSVSFCLCLSNPTTATSAATQWEWHQLTTRATPALLRRHRREGFLDEPHSDLIHVHFFMTISTPMRPPFILALFVPFIFPKLNTFIQWVHILRFCFSFFNCYL